MGTRCDPRGPWRGAEPFSGFQLGPQNPGIVNIIRLLFLFLTMNVCGIQWIW